MTKLKSFEEEQIPTEPKFNSFSSDKNDDRYSSIRSEKKLKIAFLIEDYHHLVVSSQNQDIWIQWEIF